MSSFSKMSLIEEIDIGFKCCKKGLIELNNRTALNPSVFIPLLLLSVGIERMIKSLFCCEFFDKHGSFPNLNDLKGLGHELDKLVDYICEIMEKSSLYTTNEVRKSDYNYLKHDVQFRFFLNLLTDFAKSERYYNLNEVTGKNGEYQVSPDRTFSEQITKYIQDNYPQVLKEMMQPPYDTSIIYSITNEHFNRIIQKFLQIYCFCCTQGAFGNTIRQLSAGKLNDFLFLKYEEMSNINFTV